MPADQFLSAFRDAVKSAQLDRASAMLLDDAGLPASEAAKLTAHDLVALIVSYPLEARSTWMRTHALAQKAAPEAIPAMLQLLPPGQTEPVERFRLYKAIARQFGHRQMAAWVRPRDLLGVAETLPEPKAALLAFVMLVRILASHDGAISVDWSKHIASSSRVRFDGIGETPEALAWYLAHPELMLVGGTLVVDRMCTMISRGGSALDLGRLLLYQNLQFERWGNHVRRKLWALCLPRLTDSESSTLLQLAGTLSQPVPDIVARQALRFPQTPKTECFMRSVTAKCWSFETTEQAASTP